MLAASLKQAQYCNLSDYGGTRSHNHLIRKWKLNYLAKLAKWLSCVVSTSLYCALTVFLSSHQRDRYSQNSSVICLVCLNGWVFIFKLSGSGFKFLCGCLNFRYCACFELAIPWNSDNTRVWIQPCCVCDTIKTESKHHTDTYSLCSPLIWPVWLNGRVFVYELSACGFESHRSHLYFKYCTCSKQGDPWYSITKCRLTLKAYVTR